MSGRRNRERRKAARAKIQAAKSVVREELRARSGEGFWAGFTFRDLGRRLRVMTWRERLRFLTGRCVYCGRRWRKKRWSADCDGEVCMYTYLDVMMRRRGHDFPEPGR